VLSVGFLLLLSLLLSAALEFMGQSVKQFVPLPPWGLQAINWIASLVVITIIFALMFKYVPSAEIAWKDVLVGAIGTGLLFTIGKWLLGIYLAKASVGATYGAAGTLVAAVVWIYYSAQIFFFGAEFTRVYAENHGSRRVLKAQTAKTPLEPEASANGEAQLVPSAGIVPEALTAKNATEAADRMGPRPKLLLAMGVGFILGAISLVISKRHSASLP